jgi:hypothetical protein
MIPKTGRRFRKGSCSNERSRPRSDSIELDRSPEDTIREQAIAETPAAVACGPGSALPLSYRRMERRAGFEPATPRLSDEVTAIFTTDRERFDGNQATGEALAGALFTAGKKDTTRERAIAETPAAVHLRPGGRFKDEVTAIFTTDRERVGGEQSMLLLLRRAMLSYGITAGGIRTPRPPNRRSGRRSTTK